MLKVNYFKVEVDGKITASSHCLSFLPKLSVCNLAFEDAEQEDSSKGGYKGFYTLKKLEG